MKKNLTRAFLLCAFVLITACFDTAMAQPPAPPEFGSGGNKGAMDAPIDSGLLVFFAFALGYTGREWVLGRKRKIIDN